MRALAVRLGFSLALISASFLFGQENPAPALSPAPTPSPQAPDTSGPQPASSPLSAPEPQSSPAAPASGQPNSTATPAPLLTSPELLPETNQLPATPAAPEKSQTPLRSAPLPYDLIPQGRPGPALLPQKPSTAQELRDKIRFRQLKSLAEDDPTAIRLKWQAAQSSTLQGRREYLRAYYQYMAAKMRKVEPRLKTMIDAFETASVNTTKQVNIKPTIPLRDLDKSSSPRPNPVRRSQATRTVIED
jgi:hypothetical protein